MNTKDFLASRVRLDQMCDGVLDAKGRDYAGEGGDRFANFKLISEILKNFHVDLEGPFGPWSVYFLKHVFAILAWAGQGTESEPIVGRIVDARNYLDLFHGMVEEKLDLPKTTLHEWSTHCGPECRGCLID